MLYIALAEAALLLVVIATFASLIRSLTRAHARREDLLLNQMCNLAGKPWQPAPSTEHLDEWRERLELAREERQAWTTSPEQGL
jgi:hypothetical protein